MGMGTGTGMSGSHLHTSLLWVCLHCLQCSQSPSTFHDDLAVLRFAKGQDAQGCAALLTHLQGGSQGWLRPGQQTLHHHQLPR